MRAPLKGEACTGNHHSEYRIPIVTFPRTIAPSLRTVEVYRSSKFVGFRNLFLTPCRAQCGVNSELRRAALRRNWRPHRRLHAGDSRECEGHGGGHQPGTEAQAETGGDGRSFVKFAYMYFEKPWKISILNPITHKEMKPNPMKRATLLALLLSSIVATAQVTSGGRGTTPPPVAYTSVNQLNMLLSQLEQVAQSTTADLSKLRIDKWKTDSSNKRQTQEKNLAAPSAPSKKIIVDDTEAPKKRAKKKSSNKPTKPNPSAQQQSQQPQPH